MLHLMEYWTCPECKTAYGAPLRETVKIQPSREVAPKHHHHSPPAVVSGLPQTRLPPHGNTQDFGGEGKSGISPIHGRVKPWVNIQQMPHPVWGPWGWSNLSVSHITEYTLFYRMLISNSPPNIGSAGSVMHNFWKWESCSCDLALGKEKIWHWNRFGFSAIDLDSKELCCLIQFSHWVWQPEGQNHPSDPGEGAKDRHCRETFSLGLGKEKEKGTQPSDPLVLLCHGFFRGSGYIVNFLAIGRTSYWLVI